MHYLTNGKSRWTIGRQLCSGKGWVLLGIGSQDERICTPFFSSSLVLCIHTSTYLPTSTRFSKVFSAYWVCRVAAVLDGIQGCAEGESRPGKALTELRKHTWIKNNIKQNSLSLCSRTGPLPSNCIRADSIMWPHSYSLGRKHSPAISPQRLPVYDLVLATGPSFSFAKGSLREMGPFSFFPEHIATKTIQTGGVFFGTRNHNMISIQGSVSFYCYYIRL